MTYRDDHDAALERIDALEADLKRAESERDELKDQLANKLVVASTMALTPPEVTALAADLEERGLSRYRSAILQRSIVVGVAMAAAFPLSLFAGAGALGVLAALAVVVVTGQSVAISRSARARWQPVVDAVRDDPNGITVLDFVGSETGRDRLDIHAGAHELVVHGRDARELLTRLERRCPHASIRR